MFKGLSEADRKKLEFEVISDIGRTQITRLFRQVCRRDDHDHDIEIIHRNRIINIARQVEGRSIYVLESDGDGHYQPAEVAWHLGELELIAKRQSTEELLETLCDLVDEEILSAEDLNRILENDNCKIQIDATTRSLKLSIVDVEEIPEADLESEHPNIRKLVYRMDTLFESGDYPGVLHASGSVFETLAKDVVKKSTIDNQPLGSFFEAYKNKSSLAEPILEYIKAIYNRRNTEPLAGHGAVAAPSISRDEAVVLLEMTKTFVRMERRLSEPVATKK